MSDNVTQVEFGKRDRDAAKAFARLMGIVESAEADILARPGHYLEQAATRIAEYREQLREAQEALRGPAPRYDYPPEELYRPLEVVRVLKADLDRLRACAAIVNRRV